MTDDILKELRKDGRLEKEGEFRLDPEKAREKLRLFRLPDPHRWVLEIVSAANLLGASKVEFKIDADEVEASFDGSPFQAEDLADLFNAAFRKAQSPGDLAAKQLAIGFTAAEALKPASFILESGTARLTLAPGAPRVDVIPVREGTRIYFRESFRAAHVLGFFKNLSGIIAEKTYLKDFAKYSETVVMLDKVRISFPFNFGGHPAHGIVETDGTRGHVRILPGEKTSRTHLTQFGVLVLTETTKGSPGSEAILDCPNLQRDMSNASFVKDDAFKSAIGLSQKLYYEGVYNLYQNIPPHEWYQHSSLEPLVMHVVETLAEQRHRGDEESPMLVRLGRLFEAFAIWPMADRANPELDVQVGSLAKTSFARVRRGKKLYISTEHHPLESISGKSPVILVTKRHILDLTVAEVEMYLGMEVEDVTEDLQRASLVGRNRSIWTTRSWPTTLSTGQCIRTLDSQHGAYSISVGIAHEKAPPSTAVWVKDSHLLCQKPCLFDVLISGPVPENPDFSGPSLTEQNKKLAFDAVHEIHRLFLAVSKLTDVEPESQIRRAGRTYFAALASRTLHGDILSSLGFGEAKSEFWNKYALTDSPLALGGFQAMGETLDSVVSSLGDFADLRIFERVDGKGSHSFAELVIASKKSQLLVVKEADRDQLFSLFSSVPSSGTFIWTDSAMDRALYAVFGSDVKPGLDDIMAFSQAKAFLQRNVRPFAIEQPARYTVTDQFEVQDCEVIMAWRHPGRGTRSQFVVRYFHEDRILEEDLFDPLPGEFLVYIRGPGIEPNSDFSAVDRSKKRTKIELELVRRGYDHVLAWLGHQLELPLGERSVESAEIVSRLVFSQPRKLRDLKFLNTVSGEKVSPGEVRKWKGPLAFSESNQVVADYIPADSPGVLLEIRTTLESLFPKTELVDCSAREGLIESIQRNRTAFFARPKVNPEPPANRLAELTFCQDGLSVHLWMLPDSAPGNTVSHMSLDVVFEDRVLCAHTIRVPLGRFAGVIHGASILPDINTYDRMANVPDDLDVALLDLAQTCFLEWNARDSERELALWYLSRCGENTQETWPDAHVGLRQRRVFDLCDGTTASLDDLVQKNALVFWSRSADELNLLPASQVVLTSGVIKTPMTLFPDLPWRHVNTIEAKPPGHSAAPSVIETGLVRGQAGAVLKDWLVKVPGVHAIAFSSRVGNIGLRQLGGSRLFAYKDGELVMDVEHPVGLALASGEENMLPFAASSLYSFLGASDSFFDCTVELGLHRDLASQLLQDLPTS